MSRPKLAPTLSAGDMVVLDNLAAHKSPKAEAQVVPQRYTPMTNVQALALAETR